MKPITTSISTFRKIIEADYLYVDKTKYIYDLVREPFGQFFFSRPRRFGKSLTISTLEAVFNGEKELFKGLFIYGRDYDWKKYPIIHIDFGRSDSTNKSVLEKWLTRELREIAKVSNVSITGTTPALLFGDLIKALYNKYGCGVVILIDEYDRPITNSLEDGKSVKEIRIMMEAFYQIIKGYEAYERFVFLTGITKLSQVSIFSKLNNLTDISRNTRFAGMVGYTGDELDQYFGEYWDKAAEVSDCTVQQLKDKLEYWYDGFRFTFADVSVFNPISIGNFINENYDFRNYWYATATPTMLVNQAKKQRLSPDDIANATFTELAYNSFDITALNSDDINVQMLIQLLFQTGYLTFGDRIDNPLTEMYRLKYPNYEVQISFEKELASIYSGKTLLDLNNTGIEVQQAANQGDPETMICLLKSLFAGIPYDIQLKYEKYYQSLLYLVFRMCGMDVIAEDRTNKGRIDAVLKSGQYIYIIECKLGKTAGEAMNQIDEKNYSEKFLSEAKQGMKICQIGINFSYDDEIRNIDDYNISWL